MVGPVLGVGCCGDPGTLSGCSASMTKATHSPDQVKSAKQPLPCVVGVSEECPFPVKGKSPRPHVSPDSGESDTALGPLTRRCWSCAGWAGENDSAVFIIVKKVKTAVGFCEALHREGKRSFRDRLEIHMEWRHISRSSACWYAMNPFVNSCLAAPV